MYELDAITLTPELKVKAAKEVKDNLEINISDERTYIIVVAVHKERSRNTISRISCKKGLPIGGHLYDLKSDSYHIECKDYLHLGFAPLSFIAKMKENEHWSMRVPMPENVIKKHLTSLQKKELKNFKAHFRVEEYDLRYIQMIDPN